MFLSLQGGVPSGAQAGRVFLTRRWVTDAGCVGAGGAEDPFRHRPDGRRHFPLQGKEQEGGFPRLGQSPCFLSCSPPSRGQGRVGEGSVSGCDGAGGGPGSWGSRCPGESVFSPARGEPRTGAAQDSGMTLGAPTLYSVRARRCVRTLGGDMVSTLRVETPEASRGPRSPR